MVRRIQRALLSVSDKKGLVEFATGLQKLGIELLSTGGTADAIQRAGLTVRTVQAFTGSPEMFGGRVKTLHPRVHAGILWRRDDPSHRVQAAQYAVESIDIVVVNLYPFRETVARGASFAECIENIDIGGPAMIRSAAKNHQDVVVLVDPSDYEVVLVQLKTNGDVSPATRLRLTAKAFLLTANYDSAVATYFAGHR